MPQLEPGTARAFFGPTLTQKPMLAMSASYRREHESR
jgi:hypothetical protein